MHNIDYSTDSALIDKQLGFGITEIEIDLLKLAQSLAKTSDIYSLGKALHQGHQTWIGLDPQTLQTPYQELRQICDFLKPPVNSQVVDLGAGYGRLGLVLHQLYPGVKFSGFEYVKERVAEGNRVLELHGCSQAKLLVQDLLQENFSLPEAQYYFIYDYGFPAQIRQTLKQFQVLDEKEHFIMVARGEGIRSQIHLEHPWLCQVFTPYHQKNFSIYSNYCELSQQNLAQS